MSGRRSLSAEERILWDRVSRTVRRRHKTAPARTGTDEDRETMASALGEPPPPVPKKRADKPASPSHGPTTVQHRQADPVIDPSLHRRIARGRIPVEATLDLHGMTQDEALSVLRGFIPSARQRGLRTVIIVTGKGSSPRSEGILRRMVPQWLTQPAFRDHVAGFDQAARGHGGEGALYVRLRRRRDHALGS